MLVVCCRALFYWLVAFGIPSSKGSATELHAVRYIVIESLASTSADRVLQAMVPETTMTRCYVTQGCIVEIESVTKSTPDSYTAILISGNKNKEFGRISCHVQKKVQIDTGRFSFRSMEALVLLNP
ncbi:hypothetical protein TNCV_1255421 [Trichonephila clavipes]|nr:hypothetical protein TNCV_1255421 [Trichonephila clavipes]